MCGQDVPRIGTAAQKLAGVWRGELAPEKRVGIEIREGGFEEQRPPNPPSGVDPSSLSSR